MKLFIPLEDATMGQLNEQDRLVPYQLGMFLLSQVEILPVEDTGISPGAVPECLPPEPPVQPPSPR